jgi:hypothetical protein
MALVLIEFSGVCFSAWGVKKTTGSISTKTISENLTQKLGR